MEVKAEFRLAEKILERTIKELEEARQLLRQMSEIDPSVYYGGQREIIHDMLPSLREWLAEAKRTI